MRRAIFLLLTGAALLGGCASYTERTSPCACDFQPINARSEVAV